MRPYITFHLHEFPDVRDLQADGRASRVGRLDEHSYLKSRNRRETRRRLKRRDKARLDRLQALDTLGEM